MAAWVREPGSVDYTPRSEELGDSGLRAGSYDPSSGDAKPTRFERRMDAALHPRQRRHHAKRKAAAFKHPQTRVQALLEDIAAEPEVNIPDYSPFLHPHQHFCQMCDAGGAVAKVGVALAVASVADGVEAVVDKVKERAMREQREKELAKRRKYYAAEHEKYRREVEKIRTATPASVSSARCRRMRRRPARSANYGQDLQTSLPDRICKPDRDAAGRGIAANPVRNRNKSIDAGFPYR